MPGVNTAAKAHSAAEIILTSRTALFGTVFQIANTKPNTKFVSTRAKKMRSRQQRVSLSNPRMSSIQTAYVTIDQLS